MPVRQPPDRERERERDREIERERDLVMSKQMTETKAVRPVGKHQT